MNLQTTDGIISGDESLKPSHDPSYNILTRTNKSKIMKNELVLFALLSFSSSVFAENWAQWRGPFHNGSTTETNLPTKWSQTENIAWVADLPGASAATPVVWEDNVFVSSGDKENDQRGHEIRLEDRFRIGCRLGVQLCWGG